MIVLIAYIIIAFLFFLGFSFYDFIVCNLSLNIKKAIKHPFSLLYCFLYDTTTENPFLLLFMAIFWPISMFVILLTWLEGLFEDKLEGAVKKGLKKLDEEHQKAKSKIGLD